MLSKLKQKLDQKETKYICLGLGALLTGFVIYKLYNSYSSKSDEQNTQKSDQILKTEKASDSNTVDQNIKINLEPEQQLYSDQTIMSLLKEYTRESYMTLKTIKSLVFKKTFEIKSVHGNSDEKLSEGYKQLFETDEFRKLYKSYDEILLDLIRSKNLDVDLFMKSMHFLSKEVRVIELVIQVISENIKLVIQGQEPMILHDSCKIVEANDCLKIINDVKIQSINKILDEVYDMFNGSEVSSDDKKVLEEGEVEVKFKKPTKDQIEEVMGAIILSEPNRVLMKVLDSPEFKTQDGEQKAPAMMVYDASMQEHKQNNTQGFNLFLNQISFMQNQVFDQMINPALDATM